MLLLDDHKQKIRQCFNKAAPTYDQYCHAQKHIGKTLIHRLIHYKGSADNIIDLGCGSGIVTEQLALNLSYKLFYAIDMADQLLAIAHKRLMRYEIKIKEGDFAQFSYANRLFDLAFSNMALQWSTKLDDTLLMIDKNLAKLGFLAMSMPLLGTFSELVSCAKGDFFTAEEVSQLLFRTGFEQIDYFSEVIMVPFDSAISALKAIKALGANYTVKKQHVPLRGKSFLNQFTDKPFLLSYRIGYFIARTK